jgi:hypothetical protein
MDGPPLSFRPPQILMPYRPRELVVRAREAAAVMLSALDRKEMVARFVDIYAAENRRPGRADQPSFYREQLQTIRRESILAMVLRIEAGLPARLKIGVTMRGAKPAKRRPAKSKKGKRALSKKAALPKRGTIELAIPFLDLFREEFFVALGQYLEWSEEDAAEFWRDLELYEKLSEKRPARVSKRKAAAMAYGPFADRVAMLLDPSLMEQARRAAAKFQVELNSVADRILRRTFARR